MTKETRLINRIKQELHEVLAGKTKLSEIELRDKCYSFRKNYGHNPDIEEVIFILTDIINRSGR
jgi:hypothetical protein